MINVVVLGGGFAGVKAVLSLEKYIEELDLKITLIDKSNFHLFTPSLYQVVTSEEPKRNISIPFSEIFNTSGVEIISDGVERINAKGNFVELADGKKVNFDYLIICLGSEVYYRDIPGLEKNSLPLKNLSDVIRIKRAIQEKHKEVRQSAEKLKIIVGGGGFSGTELAAELAFYRDGMEIMLIQGSQRLLKELSIKASEIAKERLRNDVKLCFGEHIKKVTSDIIETDLGNEYNYDILIWTGGVRGNAIVGNSNFPLNPKGQIVVNAYLQVDSFKNIFSAGDNTQFLDVNGKPYPGVAQVAISQGKLAAENIYKSIKGVPLKKYSFVNPGFVVALRGRFAIADTRYFFIAGFLGWVVQQLVVLRYLLGVLSIPKAFAKWIKFEKALIE